MFDAQWDVKAFDDVSKKLLRLPIELRGKAGRSAAGKAASVIRKAAISGAERVNDPRTFNQISKNIVQRVNSRYQRSTGDIMIRIGVLGGARDYSAYGEIKTGRNAGGNPGGDTFYWRFVEFGTQTAPARPFMRPAMDIAKDAATDTFATALEKAIDRAIKKGGY